MGSIGRALGELAFAFMPPGTQVSAVLIPRFPNPSQLFYRPPYVVLLQLPFWPRGKQYSVDKPPSGGRPSARSNRCTGPNGHSDESCSRYALSRSRPASAA